MLVIEDPTVTVKCKTTQKDPTVTVKCKSTQEDPTVTVKCKTTQEALFLYFIWVLTL
jgi:hypothetical protein